MTIDQAANQQPSRFSLPCSPLLLLHLINQSCPTLTMDPVTAVGLASAIISFVPLGVKLLQSAHEIRDSIDGSLDRNKTRKCIMDEMQAVSNRLKPTDQTRIAEQKGLYELAARCYELSQKILNLLNKISPKTPRSFENYRSAIRAWRKEDEIKDLEKQLKECRDQLLLALVNLSRYLTAYIFPYFAKV